MRQRQELMPFAFPSSMFASNLLPRTFHHARLQGSTSSTNIRKRYQDLNDYRGGALASHVGRLHGQNVGSALAEATPTWATSGARAGSRHGPRLDGSHARLLPHAPHRC